MGNVGTQLSSASPCTRAYKTNVFKSPWEKIKGLIYKTFSLFKDVSDWSSICSGEEPKRQLLRPCPFSLVC